MAVQARLALCVPLVLAFLGSAEDVSAQNLSFSGSPALNNTVTLTMTGPVGSNYIIGLSNSPGPTMTPLGPMSLGLPVFPLFQSGIGVPFAPAIGPSGQIEFSFSIPNNILLIGNIYFLQALYTDLTAPLQFSITNGISITILNPVTAPTISGMTPSSGGASGGTPVTITGTNLQSPTLAVTLGGNPLTNIQVPDPQTITGDTPPGIAGSQADLVVTTAGGATTLSGVFNYLPELPSIASITPDHAQVGGGSLIMISGTGLGPGTDIYIGGSLLVPLSQSASQVAAFAPAFGQLGFVDVVAVSSQGVQFLPAAFRYTIILDTGDGSDGPFNPTSNTTLDTSNNNGIFNFTEVNIPVGVTVTGTGPLPIRIKSRGVVVIDGVLDVSGEDGHPGNFGAAGGLGGPGGYPGGDGEPTANAGAMPGGGPGAGGGNAFGDGGHAAHGTAPGPNCAAAINTTNGSVYGTPDVVPLMGGSGGGGSEFYNGSAGAGGGGGGGALSIAAGEHVVVTGTIDASGGAAEQNITPGTYSRGGAGSGGAVVLRSQGHVVITGTITLIGGQIAGTQYHCGGNGRWFMENWLGQSANGTLALAPIGVY